MANDRNLLWGISFYHLCNDGTLMAIVALLPILVEDMGVSYSEVGLLGVGLIVMLFVQYGVGRVADRRSSRLLLEIGAIVLVASLLLLLAVDDFYGLFAAVMVMRVGAAFYHPVGSSWVTRAYRGRDLDTALGIQSGIGNLGMIVAWLTSGYLGESFGWRIPCVLWAFLNLAAVATGFFLLTKTGETESYRIREERIPSRTTFTKISLLAVPIIAGDSLYLITSYFGPLNLIKKGEWSAGDADLMFAFWTAVGTVTAYLFGAFSARFGRKKVLSAGFTVSGIGVILLAFTDEWYLVGAILAAYGATLYLTYPALMSLVSDATKESERGTAFGIYYGLQLVGGAVTLMACGVLAEALGDPSYTFIVALGLAIASVFVLGASQRRPRQSIS